MKPVPALFYIPVKVLTILTSVILLADIFVNSTWAQQPPQPLPEQQVATLPGDTGQVYFSHPTTRYNHAVLGDNIEAGGLTLVKQTARTYLLPENRVFEDIVPRLQDVTGDGQPEIVTIESHERFGAAVSVYRITGDTVSPLARSPWIGTAFRWLNPVGVADFTGDGNPEIAVIQTPHIGGILILYRLQDDRLIEIARLRGYSNHDIGSRALGLGAIIDWNCDGVADILVPEQGKRGVAAISFRNLEPVVLDHVSVTAPIAGDFRHKASSGKQARVVTLPLSNGVRVDWARHCK